MEFGLDGFVGHFALSIKKRNKQNRSIQTKEEAMWGNTRWPF